MNCLVYPEKIVSRGIFPPSLFGAIKEFEAAPRPPGGCPEQTSLINPPHSATPPCCSRPRPNRQTAQKRHKCFTSGHFDQKAINPNQQEDTGSKRCEDFYWESTALWQGQDDNYPWAKFVRNPRNRRGVDFR